VYPDPAIGGEDDDAAAAAVVAAGGGTTAYNGATIAVGGTTTTAAPTESSVGAVAAAATEALDGSYSITSRAMIRPPGPVPTIRRAEISPYPLSLARVCARGEAKTRVVDVVPAFAAAAGGEWGEGGGGRDDDGRRRRRRNRRSPLHDVIDEGHDVVLVLDRD
jgi:hypothetical protein